MKNKLYASCVKSVMGYGHETPMLDVMRVEHTESSMVKCIYNATVTDDPTSQELRKILGVSASLT